MSMREYAEYGLGLVLYSADEIQDLLKRHDLDEVYDLFEQLAGVQYFDEDTEGKIFLPEGSNDEVWPDSMLIFFAKRQPEPFRAVYSGIEELKKEFAYLQMPEDFDWKKHIGWYQAIYWG